MTVTDERVDLSWVEFTDTDKVEPCINNTGSSFHPANWGPAVGALYVPKCGRHPLCRPCVDMWIAQLKQLDMHRPCRITCGFHNTVGHYPDVPIIIAG